MTDIVERLRKKVHGYVYDEGYITSGALAMLVSERLEAADEIERLRAEIGRFRSAISPFSDAHVILKTTDLRAAKTALGENDE